MLQRLTLRDFRNFSQLTFEPGPGARLLLGPNGAGKTTVLEAVYLLSTTRSFRTAQLGDCCRHGAAGFHLGGDAGDTGRAHLEVGWARGGARHRRLDGRESALAEHLAVQPVLAWTAAESALLAGPPAVRRRFLDRALIAWRPASFATLARYGKALAAKRALLAAGERLGLDAWNELLAREGAALAAGRSELVEALRQELTPLIAEAGFADFGLAVTYRPNPESALEGETALHAALVDATEREIRRGLPLLGPHRDEIEIRMEEHEARRVASAGERKALGLLLLAAQARLLARRGRRPLLLLDDADTELDAARLAAVWRPLAASEQILATSNRPEVWASLALSGSYRVEAGTVIAG